MMKYVLILVIFFLSSVKAEACTYPVYPIMEDYVRAEVIAKVRIVKVYRTVNDYYRADISVLEQFKGEKIKTIYIYDGRGTSCVTYMPVNTTVLIYTRKTKDGNYNIEASTRKVVENDYTTKRMQKEVEILRLLEKLNLNYTHRYQISPKELRQQLEKFDGIQPKKKFAIYEVTFSASCKVKSVVKILGLENPIDEQLSMMLEEAEWEVFDFDLEVPLSEIAEDTKVLIGFFHCKQNKKRRNFLDTYMNFY